MVKLHLHQKQQRRIEVHKDDDFVSNITAQGYRSPVKHCEDVRADQGVKKKAQYKHPADAILLCLRNLNGTMQQHLSNLRRAHGFLELFTKLRVFRQQFSIQISTIPRLNRLRCPCCTREATRKSCSRDGNIELVGRRVLTSWPPSLVLQPHPASFCF